MAEIIASTAALALVGTTFIALGLPHGCGKRKCDAWPSRLSFWNSNRGNGDR